MILVTLKIAGDLAGLIEDGYVDGEESQEHGFYFVESDGTTVECPGLVSEIKDLSESEVLNEDSTFPAEGSEKS